MLQAATLPCLVHESSLNYGCVEKEQGKVCVKAESVEAEEKQ